MCAADGSCNRAASGGARVPFGGGPIGLVIRPLSQKRLDEAFGFAVGARGVGTGAQMVCAQGRTRRLELTRDVAGAVVGHDPLNADPSAAEPGRRAAPQEEGAVTSLVEPAARRISLRSASAFLRFESLTDTDSALPR
jgi:hypothetical protein